jgi:fatty acid desaturase
MIDVFLVLLGIAIRQVDRWWYGRGTRPGSVRAVFARQRLRRNNITPVLLMGGHWLEIAGWLLLAARPGVLPVLVTTAALGVKFRHLQEVSHFGVHGCLARGRRLGDLLTEFAAQGPLALVTVAERRTSHVREHHPNATVRGIDPNLAELTRAGVHPGCTRRRFVSGLLYPSTPRGLWRTVRGVAHNALGRRLPIVAVVVAGTVLLGGLGGLAALTVARLWLYPQLAWVSLIVEHRWWGAEPVRGRPLVVEASRCVRIYRRSPLLALLMRTTVLPYGDLYHFAHSVYPTIRWNYLPAVERLIGLPHWTPPAVLFGQSAVVATLYRDTRATKALEPVG